MMALADTSPKEVYESVGSEPTSYEFNSLMPIGDKAANPFINAGALTTTSMILGKNNEDKFERILNFYKNISGSDKATLLEAVYKSEMKTADRNKALVYYLKSKDIIKDDPEEVLDLYTKACSIGTNVIDLAYMGAVLANKGFDIKDHYLITSNEVVEIVVSQMASCGMYENSGRYLMNVGIPSKSGVSGAILGVVPGVCGLAVFSPKLDKTGNSKRGKELFKILSHELSLNIFVK